MEIQEVELISIDDIANNLVDSEIFVECLLETISAESTHLAAFELRYAIGILMELSVRARNRLKIAAINLPVVSKIVKAFQVSPPAMQTQLCNVLLNLVSERKFLAKTLLMVMKLNFSMILSDTEVSTS